MAFPHSHKHVIVLDHSPALLKSSKEAIEFDVFRQSRTPGFIPLAPITKSLWTCNVEAIVEYARVIYDIFPTDKLVCIERDTKFHVFAAFYPTLIWNSTAKTGNSLMSALMSAAAN